MFCHATGSYPFETILTYTDIIVITIEVEVEKIEYAGVGSYILNFAALADVFHKHFSPYHNFAIDEICVTFKGHYRVKLFNPRKPK